MFIRSCRYSSVVLSLGALSACQHSGLAPAASNAHSSASAAGAPRAAKPTLTAVPTPAATPTATERAAPDASPFVEGIRLGYAARLTIAGKNALLGTEKLLLGIHEDHVAIDPPLVEGLRRGTSFTRVFGSMPDAAWAVETIYEERTSRTTLARWTGAEWQDADSLLHGGNVIGLSAWSGGRTLALVGDEDADRLHFVQLAGPRGVPLPQLDATAKNNEGCISGIQPSAMSALPSGEVFLAATRCSITADDGVANHGVAVERWAAGKARGKFTVLPKLGEQEAQSAELSSMVAVSDTDVLVAGVRTPLGEEAKDEAYLAHYDGHAWHALPAPSTDHLEELQRAPDGKLWVLAGGDLWATTGSDIEALAWQQVPMPRSAKEAGEHTVTSFWVKDTGDVWATVGSDDFTYLLRTKRGSEPLSAPADAQVAELSKALDPATAYECESPTLVLLTLSRQAPKDADVPTLRAAFHGHPELEGKAQFVELPFLTRRYLAVRGDRDTLGLVMETLSQVRIPGVEPELRCLNAEPTRTLNMDFGGQARALPNGDSGQRTLRHAYREDKEHMVYHPEGTEPTPIDF